jgi:hypothetical protein
MFAFGRLALIPFHWGSARSVPFRCLVCFIFVGFECTGYRVSGCLWSRAEMSNVSLRGGERRLFDGN